MFFHQRIGAVRVAKVTRYYLGNGDVLPGVPLADCVDSHGGVWTRCRIVTSGGGVANSPDDLQSWEHWVPPEDTRFEQKESSLDDTGEVLLLFGEGIRPPVYVLGTVYTPKFDTQFAQTQPGQSKTEDYGEKISFEDRAIAHRGVRVVMAGNGTYLIDTKKTKQPIRMELDASSFVRVSQDDASEHVLLAKKTLEHVHALHEKLDAIHDRLDLLLSFTQTNKASIDTIVETLNAAVAAIILGNPGDAIIETAFVTKGLSAGQLEISSTPDLSEPAVLFDLSRSIDASVDGNSDALQSAAFRISSLSVDQQPEE